VRNHVLGGSVTAHAEVHTVEDAGGETSGWVHCDLHCFFCSSLSCCCCLDLLGCFVRLSRFVSFVLHCVLCWMEWLERLDYELLLLAHPQHPFVVCVCITSATNIGNPRYCNMKVLTSQMVVTCCIWASTARLVFLPGLVVVHLIDQDRGRGQSSYFCRSVQGFLLWFLAKVFIAKGWFWWYSRCVYSLISAFWVDFVTTRGRCSKRAVWETRTTAAIVYIAWPSFQTYGWEGGGCGRCRTVLRT